MKALYDKLPTEDETPDEEETDSRGGKVKKSFVVTTIQNEIDVDDGDLERRGPSIVRDEHEATTVVEEVNLDVVSESESESVAKISESQIAMDEDETEKCETLIVAEEQAANEERISEEATVNVVAEAGLGVTISEATDVEMESEESENAVTGTNNVDEQQPNKSE